METKTRHLTWRIATITASLVGLAAPAFATFHLMQVQQVIGGVDGDPTAQAIQLRMRSGAQNLVSEARLVAFDATGTNAIIILDLTNNVANAAAGSRVLIVSSNFVNYSSPSMAPDFILTTPIPSNYLAAGRLAWIEDSTGTIFWSLSWGGTNYTGSNTGSTLNDNDGNYGPALAGPLPSTSTSALLFTNTATAQSRSNVVDYIVTSGAATFTNNAGAGFVTVSQPRMTAITREFTDIRITWTTAASRTNFVQFTSGDPSGSFTNNFTDIGSAIVVPGNGQVATNYLDVGGVTNAPTRFYRVRLVP